MVRWRKVATIIRREYLSRVQTKAFWISTAVVPVLMLAFAVLPSLLMMRTGGSYTIAVVTADDALWSQLEKAVAERTTPEAGTDANVTMVGGQTASVSRLSIALRRQQPAADSALHRLELKRQIGAKQLSGALILPDTVVADGKAEYLSSNVSAIRLISVLERAVDAAVVHQRLTGAGVPPDRVKALTARADMKPVRVGEDLSETREGAFEKSFILSYVLSFTLYMTMMFYGYYVMRGVLEEKSSRIVEVIVANVRPMELMLGKIFGVGAVGLTQYAIWVLVAMNLAVPGLFGIAALEGSTALISPTLLVFFVVFFILGYFVFASFYAAIGAAFNTEEEAQQMQTVVSIVMALSLMFMFPVLANPDEDMALLRADATQSIKDLQHADGKGERQGQYYPEPRP